MSPSTMRATTSYFTEESGALPTTLTVTFCPCAAAFNTTEESIVFMSFKSAVPGFITASSPVETYSAAAVPAWRSVTESPAFSAAL